MVRCLNGHMEIAPVSEQFSIDCLSDCSNAQNSVMSNCPPPFRGALLAITRLRHSLLNTPAVSLCDIKRGRPAC